MEYLFWLSLLFVFCAYFGYPLCLMVLRKATPRQEIFESVETVKPVVSIIIPVHNITDIVLFADYPVLSLNSDCYYPEGSTMPGLGDVK